MCFKTYTHQKNKKYPQYTLIPPPTTFLIVPIFYIIYSNQMLSAKYGHEKVVKQAYNLYTDHDKIYYL